MHILVIRVVRVDVELRGRCSQVTFPEEVDRAFIVDHDPDPDVEFALVYQERTFYVLLNDKAIMLELVSLNS
jgi:hypothetical protein